MGWKFYRWPMILGLTVATLIVTIRATIGPPMTSWVSWAAVFGPIALTILVCLGGETSVYFTKRKHWRQDVARATAERQASCSHGDMDGPTVCTKHGVRPGDRHRVSTYDECTQCGKIDPPRLVEDDRGVWIPEACGNGHVYGPVERVNDPVTGEEFYRRCTVCQEAFPQEIDLAAMPPEEAATFRLRFPRMRIESTPGVNRPEYQDMTGALTVGFGQPEEVEVRYDNGDTEFMDTSEIAAVAERFMSGEPGQTRFRQNDPLPCTLRGEHNYGPVLATLVPPVERRVCQECGVRQVRPMQTRVWEEDRGQYDPDPSRPSIRQAATLPRTTQAEEIAEMAARAYANRNVVQPGAQIRKRRKLNLDG